MINTLPISEIEKGADNIYEAIIVLARRARQINDEQKQLLNKDREFDDDYDNYNEDEVAVELSQDYISLPKPTTIGLEEFLSGRLKYGYEKDSEDEDESES